MIEKKVNFEIHESHLSLFENQDWRYAILMGGRGNGRSGTASRYTVSQLLSKEYTKGAIMRATREDIRTSCWGELINRVTEQDIRGVFKIADNDMFMEYGKNSIRAHGFRASSGSLTARLKSLAEYNYVWIEEAEEIGEEEFRTLDDTLRTVKGRIRVVLTLNPPHKNHWIIRKWFNLTPSEVPDFYIPTLKPELKDTVFIGGNFQQNLPNLDGHTIDRYKNYKKTNPKYYYQAIEGLVPEELRGRIFSGWQQVDEIPHGARLVRYGLDFGWFPDPTVLVAIYEFEGQYILEELLHGNYISNETIASTIRNKNQNVLCVADNNEQKSINEIRKFGVNIIPTEKGKDSVSYGIKSMSASKFSVSRNSTHLWESYENYAWKVNKDGESLGEPDHLWSHCIDAVRYGIMSLPTIQQRDEERRELALRIYKTNNTKTKNRAI